MSMEDLYDRLGKVEIGQAKNSTVLKIGASAIAITWSITWGISSYFVIDKLEAIEATQQTVITLDRDVNLLKYQQEAQEEFNTRILDEEQEEKAETKAKFDALNTRIDQIYRSD